MLQAMISIIQSLPGCVVVAQAKTLEELQETLRQVEPDLLVLDVYLQNRCVFDPLRQYLRTHLHVRTLVISGHEQDFYTQYSRKIGAQGFISKSEPLDEFKKAFVRVARGEESWCRESRSGEDRSDRIDHYAERLRALTIREMEVFRLIGKWRNTEEIAGELGISSKTVEIHRIHIKQKLGFNAAGDLLHFAVEWVEMERGRDPEGAG